MTSPGPPWLERRPRKEDARGCYRYILGREPEGDAVLDRHAALAGTVGELRARFLGSEEFRQALLDGAGAAEGAAPEVELDATEEQLDRMMVFQLRVWGALGEQAPHWSVLPEDRFRPEAIEENRAAFEASGAGEAAALVAALARAGLTPADAPRLMEHGCGVGRVTAHLAAHFPEVAGVDVSSRHLVLARQETRRRGLPHLSWLRARGGEIVPASEFDIWYSRRTLQWNPPPLIQRILALAFARLAPGGVAAFQLPTWCAGYRFSTEAYLAGNQPAEPELHMLPQPEVFALAAEAGMRVLGVWEDSHLPVPVPSPWRSQLFVLRKAG